MLVCDDSYLYVLGVVGCKVCVKLAKDNHNVAGGVLVRNNTVLVMSTSHHMTNTTHNIKRSGLLICTVGKVTVQVTA